MTEPQSTGDFMELTPEQQRARRKRNWMLALSILAFVALVFFVTIARLKAGAPL